MPMFHISEHYGAALITLGTAPRTAIARIEITEGTEGTEESFNFPVVQWCDTYDEALTLLQFAAQYPDVDDETLAAITG